LPKSQYVRAKKDARTKKWQFRKKMKCVERKNKGEDASKQQKLKKKISGIH
jgi:hypothetical protein